MTQNTDAENTIKLMKEAGIPIATKALLIEYICPLCCKEHEDEVDITFMEEDLESMTSAISQGFDNEETAKFLSSTGFSEGIIKTVIDRHKMKGDYRDLVKKYRVPTEAYLAVTKITLGDERKGSCDHCGRSFESMTMLQMHQGRDPLTMKQDPAMEGNCLGPIDRTQ